MNEPIFLGTKEFDGIEDFDEQKIKNLVNVKLKEGLKKFKIFITESKIKTIKFIRKYLKQIASGFTIGLIPLTVIILAIKIIDEEFEKRKEEEKK